MKTKATQTGMGMLPTLVVVGVVIVFATIAVKLMPIYVDYWTLTRVLNDVVEEERSDDPTPAGIRNALSNRFITNRIEAISLRDIKISSDKKGVVIDARYEKRTPIMFNIDAVVRFEEAVFVVPRS
ncbi:MAG: hypothetical protein ACJA1I_002362 [Zhongshania marina]|jgi:hypothetical protein|uniref:DUF4845 domain-containing protein n=1 Tax=Zhongshania marina TaxID=2304603 RepID=A0A2S4HGU8_9GAMM|nr:DUF4845 domain-containing protein [Marortus luteolus]POP53222.1 hypothetical protein C0068_09060 [Marortus luteolus]RNL58911.1 DUF4845 domain-containing protein [Zhongshania marina]